MIANAVQLEIQWRQLMLNRLKPLLTRISKAADKEIKAAEARQSEIRELYPTKEEAHEAYGYAYITLDEYRSIVELLETKTVTPATAARDELKSLINRYRREIKDFEWEALPETEKQRISKQNKDFRAEHEKRIRQWRER